MQTFRRNQHVLLANRFCHSVRLPTPSLPDWTYIPRFEVQKSLVLGHLMIVHSGRRKKKRLHSYRENPFLIIATLLSNDTILTVEPVTGSIFLFMYALKYWHVRAFIGGNVIIPRKRRCIKYHLSRKQYSGGKRLKCYKRGQYEGHISWVACLGCANNWTDNKPQWGAELRTGTARWQRLIE